jgi:hypothetical protein
MFDNALTVSVLSVVVALGLFVIFTKFQQARKANPDDTTSETFKRITDVLRGQLLSTFELALELKKADEAGFESVKVFVLDEIMEFINETDILTDVEKALLNRGLVESLVSPYLKAMWDYKLEMPQKNLSKATLQRIRDEEKAEQNGQ